jgi:hypothetical protein
VDVVTLFGALFGYPLGGAIVESFPLGLISMSLLASSVLSWPLLFIFNLMCKGFPHYVVSVRPCVALFI